jgi:hypothetical protein
MRYEVMMGYISRRADYLARRIAEAEAVGRVLTWDKGELQALQAAIGRLEARRLEKDARNITGPPKPFGDTMGPRRDN